MLDPDTGKIDPTTFGWDNRLTGGALLGTSISRTITDGLTIDATTGMAFMLGFSKGMQYSGMDREGGAGNLPGTSVALTNCFASTYSFMMSIDTMGHNFSTISDVAGSFKGFDVAVIDPMHIFADAVVAFEMCEFGSIVNSWKNMAGLDYASIVDTATRQLLVIMVDSPEARTEIGKMKGAAECAKNAKDDYDAEVAKDEKKKKEEEEWEEFGNENSGDDNFDSLAADPEAAAREAGKCFDAVDRYAIGEISGKIFAHFFNNELKPLI